MAGFSFVSIAMYTATKSERYSICAIGITVVEDSKLVMTKTWLVKPHNNQYDSEGYNPYGICSSDTFNAPYFNEVWDQIKSYLNGKIVIGQATATQMLSLQSALDFYGLDYPTFDHYDTNRTLRYVYPNYTISRDLIGVCDNLGISTEVDPITQTKSKICARAFLKALESCGVMKIEDLQDKYNFVCGKFVSPSYFAKQGSVPNVVHKHQVRPIFMAKTADTNSFDASNYFYGKKVCFTGDEFITGHKDMLARILSDVGAVIRDNVSSKTDILVCGMSLRQTTVKLSKAKECNKQGSNIEIISEMEFWSKFLNVEVSEKNDIWELYKLYQRRTAK